ncbi:cysteate racemase [Pseudomonas lijiangensis]|uniref:Aspartate/glutamate racemase family protein n=1 Tax=Pseudomonas lijiangensis TaxID=2995658 RepID=A0ABX8HWI8_9PSED|nr:amino acid racemase [Pseudomonas lijiangensis]MBX8499271.1 aspartate/glutamate racemase family protein [Pseudomonas lijiangensis]MBX8504851.1 aspartate/glutamate racemase family protein [Pseudomonas lijiangensis]QWU85006.1 aspartate/glutamate racemase family protein [Pseudomonas lijiangensis]
MKRKSKSANKGALVRKLGIVAGLGSLAGGDLFYKLVKSRAVLEDQGHYHFLLEQHPFKDVLLPLDKEASMTSRKFYVFQVCKSFEESGVDAVMLPCFASHTFRAEIQEELGIAVLDMMQALARHIRLTTPPGATLGVIASDFVAHSGLFERYLGKDFSIVYPDPEAQSALMEAMYGVNGIKDGYLEGAPLETVYQACLSLQAQGASVLVPGMTELSLVCPGLQGRGMPVLDINEIYASFATLEKSQPARPAFKLGIVGGIGPAATVDFMGKVVANTPAGKDQEHIKMVVEQNPQIPDRTASLLHDKTDPTMAMYATCKRLENAGAKAIAIPCNTAHAFVERIQPHLQVPIVNMLTETVEWIVQKYGSGKTIGLLATSGTVQSQVYHEAARQAGLQIITPGLDYQHMVMDAIYSELGIKAGFTEGLCKEQLLLAAEHLCELGADVLILGCTELPLVLAHSEAFQIKEHSVALVDPTTILARKCVELAGGELAGIKIDAA